MQLWIALKFIFVFSSYFLCENNFSNIFFVIKLTPRFFPVHGLTIGLEVRLVGLDDGAPDVAGGGHGGVLDGGVVARGHLEVLAAGGEGPFEVDFGRVRVDAAGNGHGLLQGGSNHGDGAAAADGRICWRHD